MSTIEIEGASKHFGKVQAVRDLSFTVDSGRVTGFLGPNGAGKSTTLRMLLGLINLDAGSATFGGRRYEELEHPSRQVGAVLENASFHPGRSGRNHVRTLAAAGEHPESRVDEVLEQVELTGAAQPPRQGLLDGHAPAARDRRGAARRSGGADTRRADERARPAGHPLGARPAARRGAARARRW